MMEFSSNSFSAYHALFSKSPIEEMSHTRFEGFIAIYAVQVVMIYRIRRIFQCPGGNYCLHLLSKSDMSYLLSSPEKGTGGEKDRCNLLIGFQRRNSVSLEI
jgi:hypothetical protein